MRQNFSLLRFCNNTALCFKEIFGSGFILVFKRIKTSDSAVINHIENSKSSLSSFNFLLVLNIKMNAVRIPACVCKVNILYSGICNLTVIVSRIFIACALSIVFINIHRHLFLHVLRLIFLLINNMSIFILKHIAVGIFFRDIVSVFVNLIYRVAVIISCRCV